jgi:hypothetical protein
MIFSKKYKIHPISFFSFLNNTEFEGTSHREDQLGPLMRGRAVPLVTEQHNKKGGGRI